jgi:acyl-CoA synthetase (AMP-forming)/AMP-acid ligase II
VRAGTKIVWCGRNSTEVVAIINAARKAGAVAVPLNYRLSPDEASYVIDNSDATIVLFDVEQEDQLAAAAATLERVHTWAAFRCDPRDVPAWARPLDELTAEASEQQPVPVGEDEVAGTAMFYTSGTTGHPKGVVRRALSGERVRGIVHEIGFQPDDVYLTTGPLYHSGPHAFLQITQQLGGTVVVLRHFEPQQWLELVERHRVTTTFSAPTPIRRVLDLPEEVLAGYDISSMQRLIANAAPWPFELKRRYVAAFGDDSLFEVYGSTELGIDTLLHPADQLRKPGSCGRPAPGIELALFDADGQRITEPHVAGDLYVRGPTVLETYYKAHDKLESSRLGDWVTVGDVAYVDEEGYYYICDRRTDMIISGGMNVYPAEIEAVLLAHPSIADVAVFGIPSEEWGEQVHATITVHDDEQVDDGELDAHCREHLASYKAPRSYERIEEIPRNPSGKVLKRQLRDPYWQGHDRKVG